MRTYLVAVVAMSEQDVHKFLLASPHGADKEDATIDCWWIAEDDREDRSDNDSAIFVPRGAQMDFANLRDRHLENHKEEWDETGYPYAETDKSGCWYQTPEERKLSRKETVELGKAVREGKQQKVVELKNKGYSNVAIARELGIPESTVRVLLKVEK